MNSEIVPECTLNLTLIGLLWANWYCRACALSVLCSVLASACMPAVATTTPGALQVQMVVIGQQWQYTCLRTLKND